MSAALRPVELVEGDESPDPHAPTSPRTWLRRHLTAVIALALGLGAVLIGLQGAADAQERDRVAALATVPGVLRPLTSALRAAWQLPVQQSSAVWSAPTDGVVIAGSSGSGFALTGIDAAAGTPLWSTPVKPAPGPDAWTWCMPVARAGGDVAVCTAGSNSGLWEVTGPDRTLWVIDPRTGAVLAQRVLPMTAQLAVHGSDLMIARPADDQRWQLDATDPVTGASRWTFTTDPIEGTSTLMLDSPGLVDVQDGVLLVVPGHMWSVDADGHLRTHVSNAGLWWSGLRGGAALGFRQDGGVYRSTLVLADGTRVPGRDRDLTVLPDDGSAPDVLLTTTITGNGAAVVARSAADGSVLWTAPGAPNAAMMLDGRLYLGLPSAAEARDPRSGRVLWHRDLRHRAEQFATDGRSLLVTRDSTFVDAYELADGTPRWTTDTTHLPGAPGEVVSLGSYGLTGHLLATLGDGSVVALR